MRTGWRTWAGLWVALVACEEPPAERPATAEVVRAESPPERAPAALAPVVLADEDAAACAARLAAETPAEVRATLFDLGWVDFFGDACVAAIAVRDGTPEACDGLSARALRERCRLRVAIHGGGIAACPRTASGDGHDPLCVALAANEPALCRATSVVDRSVCEALLSRDVERCGRTPASEARCRAQHAELAPLLGAPIAEPLELVEPELVLEIRRVVPSSDGDVVSEPSTVTLDALERGAVLVEDDGALRVRAGETEARGTGLVLDLELPGVPADDASLDATLALGTEASIEIRLPDVGTLTPGTGEIRVTLLEPRLGGRLEGRIAIELFADVGSVRVEGHFRTYVRDRGVAPE